MDFRLALAMAAAELCLVATVLLSYDHLADLPLFSILLLALAMGHLVYMTARFSRWVDEQSDQDFEQKLQDIIERHKLKRMTLDERWRDRDFTHFEKYRDLYDAAEARQKDSQSQKGRNHG